MSKRFFNFFLLFCLLHCCRSEWILKAGKFDRKIAASAHMGAASSREKLCIKVAAWINSSSSLNHHHRTSSFIFFIKQHAAAALATPSLMKLWIDALAWESCAALLMYSLHTWQPNVTHNDLDDFHWLPACPSRESPKSFRKVFWQQQRTWHTQAWQ